MIKLLLLTFAVSPLTLLAAAGPALAAGPTGREFGCHVSTEAQANMFSRGMNPGMHSGFSDWTRTTSCP